MPTLRTPVVAWRPGRPPRPVLRTGSSSLASALAVLLLAALVGTVVVSLAAAKPKPGGGGGGGGGVGASGTWTLTGDMITARRRPPGALLADGRVLVAGGLV